MTHTQSKWGIARRLIKAVWIIILITILLISSVWFYIQSAPGRRMIERVAEQRLGRWLDEPVAVTGLEGRIPFDVRLGELSVGDWLSIERIELRWSWRALMRRQVHVERVRAKTVSVAPRPRAPDAEPAVTADALLRVPDPDFPLVIDHLRIDRVEIDEGFTGAPWAVEVDGALTRAGELSISVASVEEGVFHAQARASIPSDPSDPSANVSLSGFAEIDRIFPEWYDLIGDRVTWDATFLLDGDQLSIELFNAQSETFSLEVSGVYRHRRDELIIRAILQVPELDRVSGRFGRELAGAVRAETRLRGPLRDPRFAVRLASEQVRIDTWSFTHLNGLWSTRLLRAMNEGEVRLALAWEGEALSASAQYQINPDVITLSSLEAEGWGASMRGQLSMQRVDPLFAGEVMVSVGDIGPLGAGFEQALAGAGDGHLVLWNEEGRQYARMEATVTDLETGYGLAEQVRLEADVADVLGYPSVTASLDLSHYRHGGVVLSNAVLSMEGDGLRADYTASAEGYVDERVSVDMAGSFVVDATSRYVRVERLDAERGDFNIRLLRPAELTQRNGEYEMDELNLRVGPGRLRLSGRAGPEAMDVTATVLHYPLSALGFAGVPDTEGLVAGRIRLFGSPADPSADLAVRFTGIRPLNTNYWAGPPADLTVNAEWRGGIVDSRFRLLDISEKPVECDIRFPLSVSFIPFSFAWPPAGDLSGRLFAEADLGSLAALFLLDVHLIRGQVTAEAALSGTVSDPQWTGTIVLRDGYYENERVGTVIRDIEGVLRADGSQWVLEEATATDGDRGRARASGEILLNPERRFPFAFDLTLRQMNLVRHDYATGSGSGALRWTGNLDHSHASGRITLSPLELRIPERLPDTLIALDVVEVFEDGVREPEPEAGPVLSAHTMRLDVDVVFPERTFLRGRGLDSEWRGQLKVGGTFDEPVYVGMLSVIRGRFVFFGKRLGLTRGSVTWDGRHPPEPQLDIAAETRAGGVTATLTLAGDVSSPDFAISSAPEMPEDEILARLLFGREVARITPWQAVMMAQAVNSLRGGGSAFDFLGKARRFLRVDQLEVKDSEYEEGETSIAIGKYVSDRVYVELERGAGAESGRATVDIELTPRLALETEVGANAESGLGLNWSWDY